MFIRDSDLILLKLIGLFLFLGGCILSGYVYSDILASFFFTLVFVHPVFLVLLGGILWFGVTLTEKFGMIETEEV